jgi:hypothetical protein
MRLVRFAYESPLIRTDWRKCFYAEDGCFGDKGLLAQALNGIRLRDNMLTCTHPPDDTTIPQSPTATADDDLGASAATSPSDTPDETPPSIVTAISKWPLELSLMHIAWNRLLFRPQEHFCTHSPGQDRNDPRIPLPLPFRSNKPTHVHRTKSAHRSRTAVRWNGCPRSHIQG